MTIQYQSGLLITGTRADRLGGTWTSLPAAWRFFETDTMRSYHWDGSMWMRFGDSLPSVRPWGAFFGSSTSGGSGWLDGGLSQAPGHSLSQGLDITNGKYTRVTSGAASGDNAGYRYVNVLTCRKFNPVFRCKFRFGVTTTTQRLLMGLISGFAADFTGDDPLNGGSGVCLGLRSTDTIFQVVRNDGVGASVFANVTGSPAVDTNVHTVEIMADDTNTKFRVSFDGGAYTDFTTDIPAQTSNLSVYCEIETAEAVAKSIDIYYIEIEADK